MPIQIQWHISYVLCFGKPYPLGLRYFRHAGFPGLFRVRLRCTSDSPLPTGSHLFMARDPGQAIILLGSHYSISVWARGGLSCTNFNTDVLFFLRSRFSYITEELFSYSNVLFASDSRFFYFLVHCLV